MSKKMIKLHNTALLSSVPAVSPQFTHWLWSWHQGGILWFVMFLTLLRVMRLNACNF